MPSEQSSDVKFEIGHVLFIDIVGYSKLLIKEQSEQLQKLKEIVRGTEQFRLAEAEGKLLRLPTGDGGALVFRTSPEAAAMCAMEITRELQKPPGSKEKPQLRLRMGIHSGPVNEITDLNEQANIAGAGINMAQRVMDCGDANHILLSKHVVDNLEQYDRWRPLLHELGACEVKHGVRVDIINLYSDEIGNPQLPKKFQALKKHRSRVRWAEAAIALLVLAAVVAAFLYVSRRPMRSALSVAEKSIAVLPFENLSEEKQNAYFADGVQDEILTDLAKIADLKVISRTSVMQYKTGARNLREIGEQLGVAHLLEGSVQRTANKIRVNAQLIDARTDAHLWAQTYDRDLADVFAIQSEIAKAIAEQLQARLSPNEKAAIEKPPTTDLAAFDLYTRAKTLLLSLGYTLNYQQILQQAIELLNQAVARDPAFFEAYCFGEGLLARMMKDEAKAQAAFTKARLEQEKIVQAQPDYGPPLCVISLIDAALGRKEKALREGRRAIELLPVEKDSIQGSEMLVYFAIIAAWVGEKDTALDYLAANGHSYGGSLVASYGALKLLPFWDPLRGDPRFDKIVASLAPKESVSTAK